MDFVLFFCFFILSIISLAIGFTLGLLYVDFLRRREKANKPEATQVYIPKKPTPQKTKVKKERVQPRPGELGAVPRPSAEELEKKDNPTVAGEEEAWAESLGKENAEAMFNHPNTRLEQA